MSSPPRLSTLILLSALSIAPVNIFLPSLPNIARDFGVDYGVVSMSVAAYAAAVAVLQLIMGPLSDRFGRRPIVLAGLTIFVLASFGGALASDIGMFLAFRMLQAAITSGYAMSLAIVRDTTGPALAASRIGYIAMAWALAPMLGPMLGGVLDETLGWRAIFWGLGFAGAGLLALCWVDLGETNMSPSNTIVQQFRALPGLLRAREFWAYALCMAFSLGAFYAFLAGAPLVAAAVFEMAPATLGFAMGTITVGFIFGSFLSGRYAGRFEPTAMMAAGRVVACAGPALGLALFVAGVDHALALFGPCVLVGVGNGLTMPSANLGAMSVYPKIAGSAAGLAGAITVAGGAVLSSVTGAAVSGAGTVYPLLAIMLASTVAALAAALCAQVIARRKPQAGGSA